MSLPRPPVSYRNATDVQSRRGHPLGVKDATKRFGGISAVDGVTFDLPSEGITALIGANGAGKSTLLALVSGNLPLDGGRIHLLGQDVSSISAQRRSRLGLSRTFQHPLLVPFLNCIENVCTGLETTYTTSSTLLAPFRPRSEAAITAKASAALETVGIPEARWLSRPAQLSAQDRLLAEVARAIVSEPKLLLLDEPSVGFTPSETEALAGLLRKLSGAGTAVLLVTHDVPFAITVAGAVLAMDHGKLIASGPTVDVITAKDVVTSYLGEKGLKAAMKALETRSG